MKNNDIWIDIITVVSIILIIVFTIFVCVRCRHSKDTELWNNGYCSCGGHWQYEQAVGHNYGTSYIYVCDRCDNRIEVWKKGE